MHPSLPSCLRNGSPRVVMGWLIALSLMAAARGEKAAEWPASPAAGHLRLSRGANIQAGDGSRLRVRSMLGAPQVVQLFAHVDEDLMILRPTGLLELIRKSDAVPTDEPMSKCSPEELQHVLARVNLKGYRTNWEPPFLFVSSCSEAYLEHTKSILHSIYPGVMSQLHCWGLNPSPPKVPLTVIVLPDRAAFDAILRVPPDLLAYYDVESNFVVLYEDPALADAAPDFALKQAAYTIVHEGVHQLLANTGVQPRLSRWPHWVSEGIPEYFAPLQVESRVVRCGSSEIPVRSVRWVSSGVVNDLRMHTLLRTSGENGGLVRATVGSTGLDRRGYAVAWGLVHYLATQRHDEFAAYLQELSQTAELGFGGVAPQTEALFVKHFGQNFSAIERSMQVHLTSRQVLNLYRDPIVHQTHYLMQRIQKRGRSFEHAMALTTSPAEAHAWKTTQEKVFPDAVFYTHICASREAAERKLRRITMKTRSSAIPENR